MKEEIAKKILEKVKLDYELISGQFSDTRQYLWGELKKFDKYVKKGNRILDVGCGNGRLYTLLKDKEVNYVGVDNSEEMINQARTRFEDQATGILFEQGDILQLYHDDNSFDVIFAIAVLHHIPSKKLRKQALGEVKRVLKPGGYFILTVWDIWGQGKYLWPILNNYFRKIFGKSDLDYKDALIPWKAPNGEILVERYVHAFTKREIKKLVKNAGFEIEKMKREVGYNIYLIAKK
ncbi:class I SAM-dependent methyltransferase [Candidatus Falkowbacteria bacterium]|nr:class I SAM-dependent methyltransferase [Candidatus Falkowbacteria bacterium]